MITIVSGFQRCGSSLVLQMLDAAGVSVYHDPEMGWPSFETRMTLRASDPEWFASLDGRAVKWLEPLHTFPVTTSAQDIRTIWLTRDLTEQAKSASKFAQHVYAACPTFSRATRRAIVASYRRDEPLAFQRWRQVGRACVWRFEDVIEHPEHTAASIAAFLDLPLDVATMAAQVRPRPSTCLPFMLEALMIDSGR